MRAGRYDFLLARFELVVYSDDPDPKVTDFYNPDRKIPVREIECITGVLFGRREVFRALGGFRPVRFADTDLLERLKAAGYAWKRVSATTYRYHFGRCPDSLATSQSR